MNMLIFTEFDFVLIYYKQQKPLKNFDYDTGYDICLFFYVVLIGIQTFVHTIHKLDNPLVIEVGY
jgi:hypothetical protein